MLSLSEIKPMREDPPLTPSSVELAKRAQAAERALATQETGVQFDGDRPYVPGRVLTFAQKEADALFLAPSAMNRVVTLQLTESLKADELAHVIAEQAHGGDLSQLSAQQKASCRFAAVYALRAQHDGWTSQAHRDAEQAADDWMRQDGGRVFRDLSPEHRRKVAVPMASAVICAFLGLLEGSKHLAPGVYLRITEDAQ